MLKTEKILRTVNNREYRVKSAEFFIIGKNIIMRKLDKITVISPEYVSFEGGKEILRSPDRELYHFERMGGLDRMKPEEDPVYRAVNSELSGAPRYVRCQIGLKFHEIERAILIETIKACRGNKRLLAQVLGLCEKTIYNKINQYKLGDLMTIHANKY